MRRISIVLLMSLFVSMTACKESKGEKLEDRLENKSDDLEDRSDDLEDASDDIEEAVDDMEDALEHFQNALNEVENDEDRAMIRAKIIAILDAHDQKFQTE